MEQNFLMEKFTEELLIKGIEFGWMSMSEGIVKVA